MKISHLRKMAGGNDALSGSSGNDNMFGDDGDATYLDMSYHGSDYMVRSLLFKTACARSMRLVGHKWLGSRMDRASGLCVPVQKKCGSTNQKTVTREAA